MWLCGGMVFKELRCSNMVLIGAYEAFILTLSASFVSEIYL
jgi:hypothetical protein